MASNQIKFQPAPPRSNVQWLGTISVTVWMRRLRPPETKSFRTINMTKTIAVAAVAAAAGAAMAINPRLAVRRIPVTLVVAVDDMGIVIKTI